VRALDREALEPASLALREPTLDDVFLQLTGHAAEETENDEEQDVADRRGAA
jgi:ABC-2 type transport system ATP-binding protein